MGRVGWSKYTEVEVVGMGVGVRELHVTSWEESGPKCNTKRNIKGKIIFRPVVVQCVAVKKNGCYVDVIYMIYLNSVDHYNFRGGGLLMFTSCIRCCITRVSHRFDLA